MANPETCQHNVIAPFFDSEINESVTMCVSCDSPLTSEQLNGRYYEADATYGTWQRVPESRLKQYGESEAAFNAVGSMLDESRRRRSERLYKGLIGD